MRIKVVILYIYSYIFTLHSIFLIDPTKKVQMKLKQEIRRVFKYKNVILINQLPDNKKEMIINHNINKMIEYDIFASDNEYEINNVPNYDLFNKHDFDIFQQVEIIEFA